MFESIRKHSKIVMFLLFLLVIPSFVLVGIDSNYFSEKSPVVARVDGNTISQADWDNAHRMEADRIRAQSPSIDPQLLDSPQAKYTTLERLVRDRTLATAAQKMHLTASDAQLARSLQQIPAIADLRRADGSLDAEAYRALVGGQGLTPEGFEANVRRDLSINQVLGGVTSTSFAVDQQVKLALDALYERRDIQLARFNVTSFASQVSPSSEDLDTYYKQHPAKFQQAEQAQVEYVTLDLASVRNSMVLSEDDLRTYYKENITRLAGKEERRARHILINASKDLSSSEREKAKGRATEILEQLRKTPSSFADLAKKYSDDKGSADNGGDLNFFGKDAMVKPFEEAAFALKKDQISDVVETDFGYHIIQLTDIKTPRQPSFEELRASLEKELRDQQAQSKFAEVAEAFANGVYEQSDSLQAVADKLKLKIQTATGVTRTPPVGAQGPLANAKFLQSLFSDESLQEKRNTEAIEVAPSVMVAGRITNYTPAKTLPMEEVKDQVRTLYVAQKAAELARKEGESKLAAWKAAPASATGLTAPVQISREQPQNLSLPVIDAALQAPADALPAWVGVDLGAQGYAVVKVNSVKERLTPEAGRALQERQQYEAWLISAEAQAYYEMLKKRYKVEFKVSRPAAFEVGKLEN